MKVRIKKLNDKAVMPTKAHATDAGFDLYCTSKEIDWGRRQLVCLKIENYVKIQSDKGRQRLRRNNLRSAIQEIPYVAEYGQKI